MAELTLHRCRTPTNWLCPCGRVARELARAGVEYEEVRVGVRRRRGREEVLDLTGQDRVPLVVFDDGDAVVDSKRIVEHLRWRQARATAAR